MIETCRIIESRTRSIVIKIDAENNKKLLDDISKKYFIRKISPRRIEEKIGHGYVLGDLFITLKIDFTKKTMRFSIEKVKKMEYMAAEIIFLLYS